MPASARSAIGRHDSCKVASWYELDARGPPGDAIGSATTLQTSRTLQLPSLLRAARSASTALGRERPPAGGVEPHRLNDPRAPPAKDGRGWAQSEVGLTYFGKRYLSAQLGRWVSADPLAVHAPGSADLNLYAYVSGAVLKSVDPVGLCKDDASGGCTGNQTQAPGPETQSEGTTGMGESPNPSSLDASNGYQAPTIHQYNSGATVEKEVAKPAGSGGKSGQNLPNQSRTGGGAPTSTMKPTLSAPRPNGTNGGASGNNDGVSMMPNVPAGQEPATDQGHAGGTSHPGTSTQPAVHFGYNVQITSGAALVATGLAQAAGPGVNVPLASGKGATRGIVLSLPSFDVGFYKTDSTLGQNASMGAVTGLTLRGVSAFGGDDVSVGASFADGMYLGGASYSKEGVIEVGIPGTGIGGGVSGGVSTSHADVFMMSSI